MESDQASPSGPGAIVSGDVFGIDDSCAALIDALSDPLIVLAPVHDAAGAIVDFRYVVANAAACAFHHLPPGGLQGAGLLELHPASVETGLLEAYRTIVATGEPMLVDDYSYPQEVLGGEIRFYDVRAVRLDGSVLQTWRDVTDRHHLAEREKAAGERFRHLLEAFQEPLITFAAIRDASGIAIDLVYTYLNSATQRLLGLSPDQVLGARLSQLFPTVVETGILDAYLEPLSTGRARRLEVREFDEGGVRGSFELSAYPFGEEIIVVARDITERLRSEERVAESERRYRLLAENSMDMVFSLDMHATIDWVSPSVTGLLGYLPTELVGRFGGTLIAPEDLPLLLEAANVAREGGSSTCRIRMTTASGAPRWVEATPRPLCDAEGEVIGGVVGVRSVDDEVRLASELEHEVMFDALTGLAKRPLGLARMEQLLEARTEPGWALLCVGVDGLTAINQSYTHVAGDEVLVAVAARLVSAAGALDRVARIAGDEFAVMLPDIVTPADAARAADRLLDAVRGPVAITGGRVGVTACAGIAMSAGGSAQELLRDASTAMRQAARTGADRWRFLDSELQESTRRALALQAALREALDAGEVRPWLMPLVRLADGEVIGHEALAHWVRPDGSVVGPAEIIPAVEATPLITVLDRAILRQSLDLLAVLPAGQFISVNVAAASLAGDSLAAWVRQELERTGVDPSRVHLEVTETSLFQVTDRVLATMGEIARTGVSWWVDDFGTGFSSVSHLRDLPIAGLKLDRSFTSAITAADGQARRIAQGLAGLARGLGLLTIAEGVETPEQARILAEEGWDIGQGWLFGRAAPYIAGRPTSW